MSEGTVKHPIGSARGWRGPQVRHGLCHRRIVALIAFAAAMIATPNRLEIRPSMVLVPVAFAQPATPPSHNPPTPAATAAPAALPASVLEAEQARIAAVAKASRSTVSVFEPGGKGGGSGVVITPDG
ncbi:MAG: hypothetical protein ACKO38_18885, partial [Planctomycetota bacterium]